MALSLNEFKEKFRDYLLEIHWKQWSALGVASHIRSEKYWIIDIEALIISTLSIGLNDKRLLSACTEWLIQNREWVNCSRLKRVSKGFMKPFPSLEKYGFNQAILKLMLDTVKKYKPIFAKFPDGKETEKKLLQDYKKFFDGYQIRGVVKQLEILQPQPLLQLQLRGYFGVDARVEVFIYLLVNDSGNSNSIATSIFGNQRNMYTILERWRKSGVVKKVKRDYSLNKKKEWVRVFGINKNFGYLDWVRTFLFLDQLLKALSTTKWSDNEYSLSSLFRDLSADATIISQSLNIQIPEPAVYKGAQYFEPFALSILNILEKLRRDN